MQIILLMSQAPGDFPDTPVVQEKKNVEVTSIL